jgi:hypothetical protein
MLYLYIAIVSIILFLAITNIIDKNNVDTHKPPLTTSVKGGLFILCFVATATAFSLIAEEPVVIDEPGHLPYISQEIQTGFPEF